MRPLRCFSIGLSAAWVQWKTPVRLVASTCVPVLRLHAQEQVVAGDAGVVHQVVEAAVLRAGCVANAGVHRAAVGHVEGQRHAPGRRRPDLGHRLRELRLVARAAAPPWRPRAASACAIARPMPREAPVTSDDLARQSAHRRSAPPASAAAVASSDCGVLDVQHARARCDLLDEAARARVPGPTSTKVVTPSRASTLDRLLPAHGARDLAHQAVAARRRPPRTTARVDVVDERRPRVAEGERREVARPAAPAPAA